MSDPASPERGIDRLLEVIRRLRGEGGCPWDREQTLATLKPFLIEEAYELCEAVDSGDPDQHAEELGDVLLQVVLQTQIRTEEKRFDFDEVAARLADKLIRRHPHVFGDAQAANSGDVVRNWQAIKATEKGKPAGDTPPSLLDLDGIPRQLPALLKAQRVQSRVARVGFDWNRTEEVRAKIDEELAELDEAIQTPATATHVVEEVGDLLFSVVNLCRFLHINAEEALQTATTRFSGRFRAMERRIHAEGRAATDCNPAELDAHWRAVKQAERSGPAS